MLPSSTRPHPHAWSLALVASVTLLVVVLVLPSPVSAHAVLLGSDPTDGATLAGPPAEIVLVFDERVQVPDRAMVLRTGGEERVLDAAAGPNPDQLRAPVPADLPAGDHELAWRITSADSHLIEGVLRFATTTGGAVDGEDGPPTADEGAGEVPTTSDGSGQGSGGDGAPPAGTAGVAASSEAAGTAGADPDAGVPPALLALAVALVALGAAAVVLRGRRA